FLRAEVRHRTDDLVTAVAHDDVVGADIRAKGLTDVSKQRVAGQMALTVVDLFEAIDVDEREHERGARAMRTLELARHFLEPEPARPSTGQFVRRSKRQIVWRFRAVPERLSAFTARLFAIGGGAGTVVGCLRPVGRRPRPVPPRPRQDVLAARVRVVLQIVQTSQRITPRRAAITKRGRPITLLRRSQSRRGALIAYCRYGGTVATRPLPCQSAPVIGDPVATGREIIVCSVLILIRASLIARTRGLVVVRPRLILITRRLVVVQARLILVTLGLVAIALRRVVDPTNRQ